MAREHLLCCECLHDTQPKTPFERSLYGDPGAAMSNRPPGWMLACLFVDGFYLDFLCVKLEAAQAWRRGFYSSAGCCLIVSIAGQEPPFFIEFTSAVPLAHQEQEVLLFRVFRCDLPIENVCEGLWKPPTLPIRGGFTHVAINRTLQSPFLIGLRSTLGDWSKCVCESTMYIINKTF